MTESSGTDYCDKRHDDYLAERRMLIEGELESARSFDKYLVTLSSGAFALSLLFIEKIAPNPCATVLLIGTWLAFAGCLVVALLGLHYSQKAYRYQRDILDKWYTGEGKLEERNLLSLWAQRFSTVSLVVFAVGVCALIAFGFCNLHHTTYKGDLSMRKSVTTPSTRPARPARTRTATPAKPPVPRPQPNPKPPPPPKK